MPKRSSSTTDVNQLAKFIVDKATSGGEAAIRPKNPAAVALGKLGGQKGGLARAKKLSASKRTAIAKKAAKARWKKSKKH